MILTIPIAHLWVRSWNTYKSFIVGQMISAFEYVTVLISIILGLGITQILTRVAVLIQKAKRLVLYWPHILWIAFILFLHIQEWWVMYELKTFHPWHMPVFLFIMLYPINLFLLSKLLFPEKIKGKKIDLKVFYFENYRRIFLLIVVSAFLSIIYNLFILDFKITDQFLQILLGVSFMIIILKKYSQEWLHKAVSVIVVLISIASLVFEWDVWQIN